MSKICRLCGGTKTVDCFSKHSGTADGLDQRCKDCMREYKRSRRGQETKTYPILDFDYESEDWQVGKYAGYVTNGRNTACVVITHQGRKITRSFNLDRFSHDEAFRLAEEWRRETSDRLGLTRNQIRMHPDYDDVIEVQLTKDQTMITDVDNLDICQKYSLCVVKSGNGNAEYYCNTTVNGITTKFHHLITDWEMVDHINRNPLDNRLCNLRQTTPKENNNNKKLNPRKNTSGVLGVRRKNDRVGGAWEARIKQDGKEHAISFSINEYGEETAKNMAIAARLGMNMANGSTNGIDPETGEMQGD